MAQGGKGFQATYEITRAVCGRGAARLTPIHITGGIQDLMPWRDGEREATRPGLIEVPVYCSELNGVRSRGVRQSSAISSPVGGAAKLKKLQNGTSTT